MQRQNTVPPTACHPDELDYTACVVCGEPGGTLVRVYDGHQHRICLDAEACRRRVADHGDPAGIDHADPLMAPAYLRRGQR